MNLNNSVQRNKVIIFYELNMKEAILSLHRGKNPSVTNILNKSQYVIDGIWYSIGLTITKEGYSNFKEGISSDHRVMSVEFQLKDVFGTNDKITKRTTMQKASDPRDVKNLYTSNET